MLFKRKFFDEVGLFDERFFPGCYEEVDWELRGAIKGWKYLVDLSTFVHHYGSKTLATTEESKDQRANFVTQRRRLREKWSGPESPYNLLARDRYAARGQDPEKFKNEKGVYRKWVVGACRVKNGERWMHRTLTRMSEFADEIVILIDQATTDKTQEICMQFPKVVALETEPPHDYNEAWSRNHVLEMAADRHGDWIFAFDADEVIEKRAVERREELTDPIDPTVCMWVQPIIQLWNSDTTQRVDGLWGRFFQGRMFRVLSNQLINNANSLIHSGATPFFPTDQRGFSYIRIAHYGNVEPEVRQGKYAWYTKTDTDKDLNMVLGTYKAYYWRLYYGDPNPQDVAKHDGVWRTLPDPKEWIRPPYGCFFSRDAYRHVYDELGLVTVPYNEEKVISLCMLVHNEGGMITRAIDSVRPFVQEVVVVDTGSTDGSEMIAEQMGAKIYEFPWVNDFSAARNFSLSKATGNWILRIDPDEEVPWETALKLTSLVSDPKVEGYVFPIVNWLQHPQTTQNAQWALSETCRLYKNMYPTILYKNPVHEELDDSFEALTKKRTDALIAEGVEPVEAKKQGQAQVAKIPFQIYHWGYLRGNDFLEKKFDYYFKLGQKHIAANPKDSRPYFNTAVHELHLGRYQDALERYKKTLELDPKNHMAWNDCGVIYLTALGDLTESERCFKKSLECMTEHTHPEHRKRTEKNLEEARLRLWAKLIGV